MARARWSRGGAGGGGAAITAFGTNNTAAPLAFIDYRLRFTTPGSYRLYYRWRAHEVPASADVFTANSFYAPNAFNTPKTLEQLFKHNDVQVFDLKSDPEEMQNLALAPEKHEETILRLNGLLNDLLAREVGVNDGRFLPEVIRPKKGPLD